MFKILGVLALLFYTASFAQAEDGPVFYDGKTIQMLVGGTPGGGYDTYARIIAKHLPRFISGTPSVVVKNMQGAGGKIAASYLYNVSPKDGTAIGAMISSAIMAPLYDKKILGKYDPSKFQYIASANSTTLVCVMKTSRVPEIKRFEDALVRESIFGASAEGGSTFNYSMLLNNLVGTKFKLVMGYESTNHILLSMSRGEVDGMCGYDWSSFKTRYSQGIENGEYKILLQMGEPSKELISRGVPEVWGFVKDSDTRSIIELFTSELAFGRPYVAPPGVPVERVTTLRKAFAQVLTDPTFLSEAKQAKIEISPISGNRAQKLIEGVYKTPDSLLERAREAVCQKC